MNPVSKIDYRKPKPKPHSWNDSRILSGRDQFTYRVWFRFSVSDYDAVTDR